MTKAEKFADFYDKFGNGEGWPDDCYLPKDDPGNCHGRICLHNSRQNDGYDLILDTWYKMINAESGSSIAWSANWDHPDYETPLAFAMKNPEFKKYYEKRKKEEQNRVKFSDFIQEDDILHQLKKATV